MFRCMQLFYRIFYHVQRNKSTIIMHKFDAVLYGIFTKHIFGDILSPDSLFPCLLGGRAQLERMSDMTDAEMIDL